MTASEWAGLTVSVVTIVASFVGATRWLVKHYLSELRQNGGSSLRDSVDRLEDRVDRIYELLCDRQP
jgi:hypothetical protein